MKVEGIHRVKKTKSDGSVRFYYYAYRGGPQFWVSDNEPERQPYPKNFTRAFMRAMIAVPKPNKSIIGTLNQTIDDFLEDEAFLQKSKDTRRMYHTYLPEIRKRFGDAKLHWFSNPATREMIYQWRSQTYAGKARSGDMAITVITRILNWAVDKGRIVNHIAKNMKREHKVDRSTIIWLPHEIDAVCKHLPNENSRKLVRFASLTGIRIGDICRLPTTADKGEWLEVMTSKRSVLALVPVTDEVREIIDWFAQEREKRPHCPMSMLFNSRFRPYTPDGLSSVFMRARDAAGVPKRFHDLKGTAVTHYASCGFSKEDIALFVGWEVATVKEILHTYVDKSTVMRAAVTRLKAVK